MEGLNYGALRFWMDLLQLAALAAIGLYTWVVNRSRVNRAAIEEVEERVDGHDQKIAVLESRLAQAPTHHDIGQVYDRLNGVARQMENLTGQLSGIRDQLSIVNEYLINRSDGGGK